MNTCSFLSSTGPRDGWRHMGDGAWDGWMLGWGLLLLFLTLVATAVGVALIVRMTNRTRGPGDAGPDRVERGQNILTDRYARGEIDTDEYRQRLATLTGAPGGGETRPSDKPG